MVRAWYMDSLETDQRLPHMTDPPQFLDTETLKELSGVLYFKLDADKHAEDGELEKLKDERGYSYEDHIEILEDTLPNYNVKIKAFFTEHLHSDEEIRFILGGSGYFDVRDRDDKWIRIECVKGDLLILPAGIYHRFTLDTKDSSQALYCTGGEYLKIKEHCDDENYIKAMRFFVGEPVWTPVNRPADDHPARVAYLKGDNMQSQSVAVK